MMKRYIYLFLLLVSLPSMAQQKASLEYRIEAGALAGKGDFAPFWFTANRYGIYSAARKEVVVRPALFYHQEFKHSWRISAGVDLTGGKNLISKFWVHQAYADVSWNKLSLSIGAKERPGFPFTKNEKLSSGGLVEGANARPIPQIRGEIKEYLDIPGTRKWLALKGHIAFGRFLDGNWQKDFVSPSQLYIDDLLYHSKSIMFRMGNRKHLPLDFEFGILTATQFGGKQYHKNKDGSFSFIREYPHRLKNYWHVFTMQGGGQDNPEIGERTNVEGNALGSWNFALNGYFGDWKVRAYLEHYFEDHSQMFWEYGRWKDGQLGFEITLPDNKWITEIVWEGVCMKDQNKSVSLEHDIDGYADIQSGSDNYYNHGLYLGWQYYGQGIGLPLIPGPLYNADGTISFKSNRIRANHLGMSGDPSEEWNWRLLASFVRHWGTYNVPLDKQRKQFSGLLEVTYSPRWVKGWSLAVSAGLDRGNYLGNQTGGMITLRKTGGFKW